MLWQLIAHGWGDYILQSDWMAQQKTKSSVPALVHALMYTLCFLPFLYFSDATWLALAVIGVTHFLIDRFRIARFVCFAKNFLSPPDKKWWRPWANCSVTGYPVEKDLWMSVWLLIIADNVLHLTINALALEYL